ncbi:TPA: hypothetical protein ACXNPU_002336 [Proteus mirabilis]
MNGRILAVWGNNDLNVNAQLNACRYRAILNTHHQADIVVFPHASHGLLRVPEFNYQLESDWPIYRQLQVVSCVTFLYSATLYYQPI